MSATSRAAERPSDRRLGARATRRRIRGAIFLRPKTSADRQTQHGVHRKWHLVQLHAIL